MDSRAELSTYYDLRHSLHEHFTESFPISCLKTQMDEDFLMSSLREFHVEHALYVKLCKPYVIVDVFGNFSRVLILKL